MVVNTQNKVEMHVIETDRVVGDKWIVTKGLKAGDRLIVEGLVGLRPDTVVNPGPPQQITRPVTGN